jgi:hypothetical protein
MKVAAHAEKVWFSAYSWSFQMASSASELSLRECVELRVSERSTRSALEAAIDRYEARKLKRRLRRTAKDASTYSLPTDIGDHLKVTS